MLEMNDEIFYFFKQLIPIFSNQSAHSSNICASMFIWQSLCKLNLQIKDMSAQSVLLLLSDVDCNVFCSVEVVWQTMQDNKLN